MQRSRIGAGTAVALAAAALVAGVAGDSHSAHAQEDPASRALLYLQAQQRPDGSIPAPAGSYDPSDLYAISAAAAGYDPNSLAAASGTSVLSYLKATASAACTGSSPARCGRLIQAAVAAGANPHAFGGIDAVTALQAAYASSTGTYGDGQAFTQALAIQGLIAAGAPVPNAALTFLEGAQNSDGGWDYLDIKDDSVNVYDTSDTNSTAMVLMALDAAGDHSRDAPALSWLATQQDPDGGFPYQAGAGTDPDSTALALQAIVATGGDPQGAAWSRSGHTPVGELTAMQDPVSGGYAFPGNGGPDAFTTAQVPAGLLLQPYPVSGAHVSGFTMASETRATLSALEYLQGQQATTGDGSVPAPPGDLAPSELFAIGAATAGYDPKALRDASGASVMGFLAAHASSGCAAVGACGELIQAVVAAGMNPRAFGGRDLVATLDAGYAPASGKFGDGQTFTQALAIQGMISAGQPVPAAALTFLAGAQNSDGGWDYLDIKGDASGSDTNSTAMAIMALDAVGDHSRDAHALSWLAAQQDAGGGFPFQAGSGSDPDSTALVIQALIASGQDPAALAWAPGGHGPIAYLVATQTSSGGFAFPGNPSPDAFTTSQVPFAFERVAFPVPFGTRAWYQPGATLGSPPAQPGGPTTAPAASGPSAGVVTPATVPNRASRAAPRSAVLALPVAAATAPSAPHATAPASPAAAAPPTAQPAAPSPAGRVLGTTRTAPTGPAAIVYILVAFGAAILVGGAGLAVARR